MRDNKSMRLSYYGGMDTYYMNTEAASFQIVPIIDKMTCLKTGDAGDVSLSHPFPDMELFNLIDDATTSLITDAFPEGVDTHVWEYKYGKDVDSKGDSTFNPPDAGSYVGTYRFYVDANTGKPIRHHMVGHNVNLGGSHYDEYILDYVSYTPTTASQILDSNFAPPPHMKCIDFSDIISGGGPKNVMKGRTFRNPMHDIVSHFPQGADQRADDFAKFEAAFKTGGGYADEAERRTRVAVFHNNLRYISAANRQGRSYHLAVNHMADWTADERSALLGRVETVAENSAASEESNASGSGLFGNLPTQVCGEHVLTGKSIPDGIDWREDKRGVVLPAKDQGTCGSCWTYGVTGTIEGQVALKTGKTAASLSQQNLMDCSWGYANMACDGGLDYMGLSWMLEHNEGRIATADSYGGYLNQDGFCHYDSSLSLIDETVVEGAKVASCTHVTAAWSGAQVDIANSTARFNDALANIGPLSISVDAGPGALPEQQHDFYFYSGGVYYNPDCGSKVTDLDHTVLAVGYETLPNGDKYTIIRNSWSNLWGEDGYMRILQKDNVCGIMTSALYVTLE